MRALRQRAWIPALALLWSCRATQPPALQSAGDSLLRITTQPDSLTLCQGMERRVAVGVSWAGSGSPSVSALPEISWHSRNPDVVAVDSTGLIVGVAPGSGQIVVLGTVGSALGRTVLPVRVLGGRFAGRYAGDPLVPECVISPPPTSPLSGVDDAPSQSLDSLLTRIRSEHPVPALASAAVRGHHLAASGAVGIRSIGGDDAVTVRDRFHLGSLTKAITASMLATLVEDGTLAWSTRLADVFSDSIHPRLRDITLEQVLAHRGLIEPYTRLDPERDRLLRSFSGDPMEQRRKFVRWLLRQEPAIEETGGSVYSNAGYTVAAAVAETVTGRSWETLVEERVFDPLDLGSAGFGWPTGSATNQPSGHWRRSGELRPVPDREFQFPEVLAPAGDVHMNIEDLAKFAGAHLRGVRGENPLLRVETVERLHTPLVPDDRFTLGMTRLPNPHRAGEWILQSTGSAGTFFAVMWVLPHEDLAVVTAANAADQQAREAVWEAHRRTREYLAPPSAEAFSLARTVVEPTHPSRERIARTAWSCGSFGSRARRAPLTEYARSTPPSGPGRCSILRAVPSCSSCRIRYPAGPIRQHLYQGHGKAVRVRDARIPDADSVTV